MDIYKWIGKRAFQIKNKKKLSYKNIADKSGISVDHIKKMFRSERKARLDKIQKLANSMGVVVMSIFPLEFLLGIGHSDKKSYLSSEANIEEILKYLHKNGWIDSEE